MASYSYDASNNTLTPVAGTPVSKLNEATSKAEASLDNQSDYIEAGTVATHAHAKGDFINYGTDKQFAEVTSAIAIGDSITNGGNVDNLSIGGVLTGLKNALSGNYLHNNTTSTQKYTCTLERPSSNPYGYTTTNDGLYQLILLGGSSAGGCLKIGDMIISIQRGEKNDIIVPIKKNTPIYFYGNDVTGHGYVILLT